MRQKKAQEIGRTAVLIGIAFLIFLVVMLIYLWKTGNLINFSLDRIFG